MEWSEAAVTGKSPPARFDHTAVFLPEQHKMLVFGGYGAPLSLRPRGCARVPLLSESLPRPRSLSRGEGHKSTGPRGGRASVERELRCFASEQPCLRVGRSLDPRHEGARPVQGAQGLLLVKMS